MKRVLIVGAGPAGTLAAYLLSKKNYQVTLIESRPGITHKVCGEYLCPPGKELLENLGFKQFISENFEPIQGMRIVSQKGTEVPCYFPRSKQGISLIRVKLEEKLIELAKAHGAKIFFNEALEKLEQKNNYWEITTKNNNFQANILIGADGRRSLVAKLLNIHRDSKSNRVAVHCFLNKKKNFLRMGEMHLFHDGSYAGLNPIKNDRTNFSIVCDNSIIKHHKNLPVLINHYIESSKILSDEFELANDKTEIFTVFPVTHETSNIIAKQAALIGDAAGFVDPLTGEGIYQALLSAQLVSENIENLQEYKKLKNQHTYQKRRLNVFFQWFIKHPGFCECLAKFLLKKQKRADTFVGIIGNIYTPLQGLRKLF